ncbi:unnamed protein product, partial [Symbiodinium microadriaticum]
AEEPKAEVPFRHLPSVATWLVPIKQGEQAENEMLCPSATVFNIFTQGNLQDGHESESLGELAAEGRRSRGSEKVEAAVQPGWAKLLQNVKVRDGKSREAKVVGFLEEGRLVRVSKVCSKSAQLEEPLVGWVTLSKGGPVLHQVPAPQQQESSTAWAVASVMARFGATPGPAPAPTLPSFENCSSADRGAEVATVAAQAIE